MCIRDRGSDERAETEALEEFYGPFNFKEVKSIDSSLSWVALDNKEVDCDEGLTTQPQLLEMCIRDRYKPFRPPQSVSALMGGSDSPALTKFFFI